MRSLTFRYKNNFKVRKFSYLINTLGEVDIEWKVDVKLFFSVSNSNKYGNCSIIRVTPHKNVVRCEIVNFSLSSDRRVLKVFL